MHRRHGFTLIELLVVVTIVGILVGITIPAVIKVRDVSSRVVCNNNLKQIGLAAHNYQQQFRQLPPAITMPYAKRGSTPNIIDIASSIPPLNLLNDSSSRLDSDPNYPFGPNWAVYLLPYLDQEALYRQANISDYLVGYNANNTLLRDRWRGVVQSQVIKVFQCPADANNGKNFNGFAAEGISLPPVTVPPVTVGPITIGLPPVTLPTIPVGPGLPIVGGPAFTSTAGTWARGNYAANAGPGWWSSSYEGDTYQEVFGTAGPVMGINFGSNTGRIKDGASSTVMFSEVRAGLNPKDGRGVWAIGYPGSSVTAANAIGDCPTPNDGNDQSDDIQDCPGYWYAGIGYQDHMGCGTGFLSLGWPSWQAQSRSMHPNGVNVCFADGSVRVVSNYVNQVTWFYMLSSCDGATYSEE
jgi:prepilin-type N-terminal cleavage/methylation domain-containing protein/prepilin-type processing-associated H-X9-DG protein